MPHPSPKTRFMKSYADAAALPAVGLPQIAFLGRSNAGKSSLINSLTGVKNLARVSATPGRTRLINLFEVDGRYALIDLPGYGFGKASTIEREKLLDLIEGYLRMAKLLRLAVVIVDSRLGPTDSDRGMMETLGQFQIPFLIVANKVDKLSKTELRNVMASIQDEYPGVSVIPHSAITGAGRGELAAALSR